MLKIIYDELSKLLTEVLGMVPRHGILPVASQFNPTHTEYEQPMSSMSAKFFTFVQGATFYRHLHEQAVALLPPGEAGARWVDIGCGPGLVTRLAANHGYRAMGFDLDPAMAEQARRLARRNVSSAQFQATDLDTLAAARLDADVVSAASLLAVLDDRKTALQNLLACVKKDGALLIIETTDAMTPRAAWKWLSSHRYGRHNWVLLLWALARSKGYAISRVDLEVPGYRVQKMDLLGGLVAAWLIRRSDAPVLLKPIDEREK
jgi:ubiquinone/menaquinone biosynthesis C-methylase UbiE